jgi:tRNA A58 N-methylase Trm61
MILVSRPQATLVAVDLLAESFEQHFGPSPNPQQRLLANLKAAGVDRRATIETADIRKLPFEAGAFDAIVVRMRSITSIVRASTKRSRKLLESSSQAGTFC